MAAARSLPPWVVLDRNAFLHKPDDEEEEDPGWATISCSRSSPIPPRPSRLSIRLDGDPEEEDRRGFRSSVLLADAGFIVLSSCLPDTRGHKSYLVCDVAAADNAASLKMLPTLPMRFLPSVTYCPHPVRQQPDADGGGYLLAIFAMDMDADAEADGYLPQVLCLLPSSAPFDRRRWGTRRPIFPSEKPKSFTAHQTFSFQGSAYWVDLGQGILFCSCHDLMSGTNNINNNDDDDLQFGYIQLPDGCYVGCDSLYLTHLPSQYRDIRCISDSIRFVSIEGYNTDPPYDMLLSMWDLTPSSRQWHKVGSIHVGSLWEQEGFRRSGLPTNTSPTQPMLSSEEDGVVYLMAGDFYEEDEKHRSLHVFSVDMTTCEFVSAWRLPPWRHSGPPSLIGSDIFKHLKMDNLCQLVPPNTRAKVLPRPPKRDRGEGNVITVRPRKVQRVHHQGENV
ncbi:hypothetical protein OsJ_12411 [Oryza sativa Japonica Group]|uniref:DUF1618 domain-containing protein n=3 Tax=Oryza sativa subsp. japonica TaxID=39947 RepID=Q75GV6_ORYSJ|nr:hypothetical protein [Oryza sativa Japonica Group]EAZ28428.1 hypothetical protein OsJ_12411 [Oryza sativa Japonica Group]